MKYVKVAFKLLEEDNILPIRYTFFRGHMIFDVNMEDFSRKARFFASSYMMMSPDTMNYVRIVSCETVRLDILISALNYLVAKCGDVMNEYITDPIEENIWTNIGPKFGPGAGKRSLVVRALYGLNSSGASFYAHLGRCRQGLGYELCLADPDLWIKDEVRPDYGYAYYSYII